METARIRRDAAMDVWDCVDHRDATKLRRLLIACADPDQRGALDTRPLHAAIVQDMNACVRALLEAGADPNPETRLHATPLWLAVRRCNVSAVRMLLDAGAEVDFWRGSPCDSIVGAAFDSGDTEIFELLLRAGADLTHFHLDIDLRDDPDEPLTRNYHVAVQWLRGTHPLQQRRDAVVAALSRSHRDFPVDVARFCGGYIAADKPSRR